MNEPVEKQASKVERQNAGAANVASPILHAAPLAPRLHLSPGRRALRRFTRHRPAMVSIGLLLLIMAFVLIWPKISAFKPDAISEAQFQQPSAAHWFGTDVHGRDLLTRVCVGAQISLLVGGVGASVSLIVGVLWGAIAGYVGGRLDNFMMRFVDILYSLPTIVFVIVLITTLETFVRNWVEGVASAWFEKGTAINATIYARLLFLFVGLGAVSWLTMARIVRGQVLSLRTRSFVDASRALGASHTRLLFRHILPNVYGVILVYLTLTVPSIILYESFLSFLGLGIQPPMASWGSLIADGASQLNPVRVYWWLIVFPGVTLVATLLALNFVGDGLRDALDPRAENLR
jgi:oligopeptide transport system permease protein